MPIEKTPTVRLDQFMQGALERYYHNKDPFGSQGDFTTAPEISQLFGEIIGIWAIQKWVEIGSPSNFNLIEIGPGRGTLMSDLLRGTKHINQFHTAANIHLVETSPTLKSKQKNTLNGYDIHWHDHLKSINTDLPVIVIANEFFDALPVRQFKFDGTQWLESYINDTGKIWVEVDHPPLKSTLTKANTGDIFEYSQAQKDYAKLLSTYHGAFLFIDYGYAKSTYGDSLQALYKHKPCAITEHVGNADLTTHVDFEWLGKQFAKRTTTLKTQAAFLKENGIDIRFQHLNNPDLNTGYRRLIAADEMGALFKVLEVTA